MARRRNRHPKPPRTPLRSTVVPRRAVRRPPRGPEKPPPPSPQRRAARIIDPDDSTLLDVIDNLLSKGVVLNADVILALAGVDLVYLRLSALLCAADRVIAPRRG